jgi:hypothetical protein
VTVSPRERYVPFTPDPDDLLPGETDVRLLEFKDIYRDLLRRDPKFDPYKYGAFKEFARAVDAWFGRRPKGSPRVSDKTIRKYFRLARTAMPPRRRR